ncbi:hypothetical protein OVA07_04965 [Novosphingobium sp. SL115]|uniref:hypothetical protein n=1 Tax=Novosphingobium sp. SL115 TaxID=2995150 RepID=UPI00227589F0|nr:hypothetical protein [Novosphingobium sp. SL115]MCY1670359.1 hypothetical protein [Novosphingobium sp. SL115]
MKLRHFALALCIATAACGQKADEGTATAAGGEVLPGSISDDMIDLDTSTASPPLAPVKPTATKAAESADSTAAEVEEEEAAPAAPVQAPAASAQTE